MDNPLRTSNHSIWIIIYLTANERQYWHIGDNRPPRSWRKFIMTFYLTQFSFEIISLFFCNGWMRSWVIEANQSLKTKLISMLVYWLKPKISILLIRWIANVGFHQVMQSTHKYYKPNDCDCTPEIEHNWPRPMR